jgi:REP element-mobilizing transposase RayT
MKDWQNQAHVKWECKYHVVIVPKYRRKVLYGKLRHQVGEILRQLCRQKGIELLQGHTMVDHVRMLLSVPPRYSIAMTVGYLSASRLHQDEVSRVDTHLLCFSVFSDTISNRLGLARWAPPGTEQEDEQGQSWTDTVCVGRSAVAGKTLRCDLLATTDMSERSTRN